MKGFKLKTRAISVLSLTVCLTIASTALASPTIFFDKAGWDEAIRITGNVDWDVYPTGTDGTLNLTNGWTINTPVNGVTLTNPNYGGGFNGDDTNLQGLYVIDTATHSLGDHFVPNSEGSNVFATKTTNSPEGILKLSFAKQVNAVGTYFLDVESDYAGSGFSFTENGPIYAFEGNQGDKTASFLGIVSSNPFKEVYIHMSSAPGGNGVGIDDIEYGVVPAPGAILLAGVGTVFAGYIKKRRML